MTTHTFTDESGYTLSINTENGKLAAYGDYSGSVFTPRPEDRPAIAALINPTSEPMFKANANFDDIQKGDTVRTLWETHGIKQSAEGVAHIRDGALWLTEEGGVVVYKPDNPTIHILSRPTPQLPAQSGSAIWIVEGRRNTNVVTNKPSVLDSDGSWFSFTEDGNTVWLNPEDITTWEPLNHVTKEN